MRARKKLQHPAHGQAVAPSKGGHPALVLAGTAPAEHPGHPAAGRQPPELPRAYLCSKELRWQPPGAALRPGGAGSGTGETEAQARPGTSRPCRACEQHPQPPSSAPVQSLINSYWEFVLIALAA